MKRFAWMALTPFSLVFGCAGAPPPPCAESPPPLASSSVSASAAPTATVATTPPTSPRLPGGEPVLRMPFPKGVVALCQQGNRTGAPLSHSYPNTLHAMDWSTPGRAETPILAAADGKVTRAVTGSTAGATEPGKGFGNNVVVDHGEGYRTLYAHLKEVSVEVGAEVKAGTVLGTMGDTGLAGNPHLHFSLHHEPWGEGAPPTLPVHGLVTADTAQGATFALFTSLELVCASAQISLQGHLYASETAVGEPALLGPAPPEMVAILQRDRAERVKGVGDADPVGTALARLKEEGAAATRTKLQTLVDRDPENDVATYWVAVLSLRDLGDWDTARKLVTKLQTMKTKSSWVPAWTLVRAAQIAEHDGKVNDAKRLWKEARKMKDQGPEFDNTVILAVKKHGL